MAERTCFSQVVSVASVTSSASFDSLVDSGEDTDITTVDLDDIIIGDPSSYAHSETRFRSSRRFCTAAQPLRARFTHRIGAAVSDPATPSNPR